MYFYPSSNPDHGFEVELNVQNPDNLAQWRAIDDIFQWNGTNWICKDQRSSFVDCLANRTTGGGLITFKTGLVEGDPNLGLSIFNAHPNNAAVDILSAEIVVGTITFIMDVADYVDEFDVLFMSYDANVGDLTIDDVPVPSFKRLIVNSTVTYPGIIIPIPAGNSVNLLNLFISTQGRSPTTLDSVMFKVEPGTLVGGARPVSGGPTVPAPSITVGNFPLGCDLRLEIREDLYGGGGYGAYFERSQTIFAFDPILPVARDGGQGGNAIQTPDAGYAPLRIYNYANVHGGGGGGGSAIEYTTVDNGYSVQTLDEITRVALGAGGRGRLPGPHGVYKGGFHPEGWLQIFVQLENALVEYVGDNGTSTAIAIGNNPDNVTYGNGGDLDSPGEANTFDTPGPGTLLMTAAPGLSGSKIGGTNYVLEVPGNLV